MTEADMAAAKGKIILVNGFVRLDLYRKILKSGAVGFISMSGTMLETEEDSDLFTRRLRDNMRAFGNMPAANIRDTDAFDMVKNGAEEVRLTVINTPITRTSHNVTVTVKGANKFAAYPSCSGTRAEVKEADCQKSAS